MEKDPRAIAVERYLRNSYRSGKIKVESSRGDLTKVQFEVLGVEDKGVVYNPNIDTEMARKIYSKISYLAEEFQDGLSQSQLVRPDGAFENVPLRADIKPVILTPGISDINGFILPSLYDDCRLFVFPCFNCGRKFAFNGRVSIDPEDTFTSEVNMPFFATSGRGYRPTTQQLFVQRLPIFVNSEFNDDSEKAYIGSLFEIISAVLEPVTTSRITRKYREKLGFQTEEDVFSISRKNDTLLPRLTKICEDEEKIVADSIAYSWLIRNSERLGISNEDLDRYNHFMSDTRVLVRTRAQAKNASLQDIIRFYHSSQWNLKEFKNGAFKDYL